MFGGRNAQRALTAPAYITSGRHRQRFIGHVAMLGLDPALVPARRPRRISMDKVLTRKVVANEEDLNRDPITGTPGAHPLGTGVGAASGGVAGAAMGTLVGGPVGALIGAVAGAVAGGLAGKEAAESVNPTAEEIYWREYYTQEPYYAKDKSFEYYSPGYRAGWEGRVRYDGRKFEDAEIELRADYDRLKTPGAADWSEARPAARAAWERIDHTWARPS
jgi:hypothetical protein